jgi:hypothetical protein
LRVPVIAPPVNSKSGLSLIEPIPRRPCTHTGKGCASRAHHREGVRWRYVPTGRDVRGWSMLGDREDELDLADIGGETGAATHGASMAGKGRGPSDHDRSRRFVRLTTKSTSRPPHPEQTRRSRQLGDGAKNRPVWGSS